MDYSNPEFDITNPADRAAVALVLDGVKVAHHLLEVGSVVVLKTVHQKVRRAAGAVRRGDEVLKIEFILLACHIRTILSHCRSEDPHEQLGH